ncbi:TetR/AcrR family transcriptional regulator C-terminal domain-containing protein [Nannocystis pusilla]|uniref:TetR/AcrR family transcriptional regulator C-terminal domain-containing protein n=1 Tax=Nannocystis pusilla TaxID=889268 RepID=UPI003DA28930
MDSIHGLAAVMRRYVESGELVDDDPYRLARAFQGLLLSFGVLGGLWGLPADPDPERDARTIVSFFLCGVKRGAP